MIDNPSWNLPDVPQSSLQPVIAAIYDGTTGTMTVYAVRPRFFHLSQGSRAVIAHRGGDAGPVSMAARLFATAARFIPENSVEAVFGENPTEEQLADLRQLVEQGILEEAKERRVQRTGTAGQADSGQARDPIAALSDGDFTEDQTDIRVVRCAIARIRGRPAVIIADTPIIADVSAPFGFINDADLWLGKIQRAIRRARELGIPLVWLSGFSAGPKPSEFVPPPAVRFLSDPALSGERSVGRVYHDLTGLIGRVPMVLAVAGNISNPLSFLGGFGDYRIMTAAATLLLSPPQQVQTFVGTRVTAADLGGAKVHAANGECDDIAESAPQALDMVLKYVTFMPSHAGEPLPRENGEASPVTDSLARVPSDPYRPYDSHHLVEGIVDSGSVIEFRKFFAREMLTALARISGIPVGIVANNPAHGAGAVTIGACRKAGSFLRLCEAYGVPVVFLADTPGFALDPASQQGGISAHGGRLFQEISRLTVPSVCVVVRKVHTAGIWAMSGLAYDPAAFVACRGAVLQVFGDKQILRASEEVGIEAGDSEGAAALIDLRLEPRVRQLLDAHLELAELRPYLARRLSTLPTRIS